MRILSFIIGLGAALLASGTEAAQWAKTYGGAGDDHATARPTADGGYIVAGSTNSFGAGGFDAWILKLDADGSIAWQKTYGGPTDDWASVAEPTPDGGFLVGGGSAVAAPNGPAYVAWVLKLDANGNLVRVDHYSGTKSYIVEALHVTSDGGYTLAGESHSYPATGKVWLLKASPTGNIIWQRTFSGGADDRAYALQGTGDGGYVVAGRILAAPAVGARVMKLDAGGNVTWQRYFGSSTGPFTLSEEALAVHPAPDGGYVVAGGTSLAGGGAWVVRLDSLGNVLWQKAYSGTRVAKDIQVMVDGGFVLVGSTSSYGAGDSDVWIAALDPKGDFVWQKTFGGAMADGANSVRLTPNGGLVVAGATRSFGSGDVDAWVLRLDDTGVIAGCAVMGTSSSLASNVAINSGNVATLPIAGDASQVGVSAIFSDSWATSRSQCYFAGPVAFEIPALAHGNTRLLSAAIALFGALAIWHRGVSRTRKRNSR